MRIPIFRQIFPRWLISCVGIWSLCLAIGLHPAQAKSPTISHPAASVTAAPQTGDQLSQGRQLYQSGQYSEAIQVWQQAAKKFQTQGDSANHALALSYLSLAHQELSQWNEATRTINQSLEILRSMSAEPSRLAQALNTQAGLQTHLGQTEAALASWQSAQEFYDRAQDREGSIGTQINQAQALQSLGFHRRAKAQLEQLNQNLLKLPDRAVKVSGLRALGTALQTIGDPKSTEVLQQGLALAQAQGLASEQHALLMALGMNAANANDPDKAIANFQQAEQMTQSPLGQIHAKLGQLKVLIDYGQSQTAQSMAIGLSQSIQQQLTQMPASRSSLYTAINFVASLNKLDNTITFIPLSDLADLMARTAQSAADIQDAQARAQALYQWGQIYMRRQQWQAAQQVTQNSLSLARQLQADHMIAQAAWQLGRLEKQQNNRAGALTHYTEAVNSLQAMRGDLLAVNSEVQFSFRESVEPVYRELVDLLLDDQPDQSALRQARDLIESLQVAELDNFFREACLDKLNQIDQVDPTATVIYPILLPDRLAVIVSTAGQPLRYYQTQSPIINRTIRQLYQSLNPIANADERLQLSQQLYDWLIRPAEQDQALAQTQTLVFVLDGILRNIPMSALHDGQQYLIERYAVTLSPGLKLMASHTISLNHSSAILAGISEARGGFVALPGVATEIQSIAKTVTHAKLLNQEFTKQALAERIRNDQADLVHLATHGQFSSHLEDTFLLTWDSQMNLQDLSDLLKSRGGGNSKPVELMVLSACDTAAGDERAVLGLAGLAVKSGARSTMATLWPVKDQAAAQLMTQFYKHLSQPGITKAEALRQAQLQLIRETDFKEPFFWSGFVLVGNWQ